MVFRWLINLFKRIKGEKVEEIKEKEIPETKQPVRIKKKRARTRKKKILVSDQMTKKIISVSPEPIKKTVSTKIDEMLRLLEGGPVDFTKISKSLKISESLIEEWAKILEEHDLVETSYPPMGSPILKLKVKAS